MEWIDFSIDNHTAPNLNWMVQYAKSQMGLNHSICARISWFHMINIKCIIQLFFSFFHMQFFSIILVSQRISKVKSLYCLELREHTNAPNSVLAFMTCCLVKVKVNLYYQFLFQKYYIEPSNYVFQYYSNIQNSVSFTIQTLAWWFTISIVIWKPSNQGL